jgi:hypothetical protein
MALRLPSALSNLLLSRDTARPSSHLPGAQCQFTFCNCICISKCVKMSSGAPVLLFFDEMAVLPATFFSFIKSQSYLLCMLCCLYLQSSWCWYRSR